VKISVFGLGYVGCVSAACWAEQGHQVVGVDVNPLKVEMVNAGRSPMVEMGLEELLRRQVEAGRLRATTDPGEAVQASELSFLCVGTPGTRHGQLDLTAVENVARQVGQGLREKAEFHTVVLRSTVLPGTLEEVVLPLLKESSGRQADRDFGLASNPEFLREGSSIADFNHPPFTLIGQRDPAVGEQVASLYRHLQAPIIQTSVRVAEMVKYVNNCFHALKVGFANEIGNLCQALGVDSHEVLEIFCRDHKLNLGPAYLKPGFAFGGSCLIKDLRAVTYRAKQLDVETPILRAILPSNELQLQKGLELVLETGKRRVGVLGLSFKAGTDDLRESPLVALIEGLIGKGLEVRIYDRQVRLAHLVGANKAFIDEHLPHLARLMVEDLETLLATSEVIVVGNREPEFVSLLDRLASSGQIIIDLVRLAGDLTAMSERYRGICW